MEPSPHLAEVLVAAGWYRGRRINCWRMWGIKRTLTRHGFVIHRAAEEFLREFGGLVLQFKSGPESTYEYKLEITGNWPEKPLLPGIAAVDSREGGLTPIALFAQSPYLNFYMMASDGRTFSFIDGLFGDPRIDNVIRGPQPDGVQALNAIVELQEWPTYSLSVAS